jgi:hypothetical protein
LQVPSSQPSSNSSTTLDTLVLFTFTDRRDFGVLDRLFGDKDLQGRLAVGRARSAPAVPLRRDQVVIDTLQVAPPVTDSYREFAYGFYRFISRPFYRPVGVAPDRGTQATTSRINETIDGSVFDRCRADATYRPPNLAAWAEEKKVDPAKLAGAVIKASMVSLSNPWRGLMT